MRLSPTDPSAIGRRRTEEPEPAYLASGVVFLIAARVPAWLVALSVVIADTRPIENLRYEPALVLLSLVQIVLGVVYVALLRPALRRRRLLRGSRRDLLVLSGVDMVLAMGVVYVSGGFNTPYYHFAVVALLVPAFLLGWAGSLAVLAVFLVVLIGIWSLAGAGTEGWLLRAQFGGPIPGLILTPLLVVLVSRYLAWLVQQLDEGQRDTRRALDETATLYAVSRAVAEHDDAGRLVDDVVRTLAEHGGLDRVSAWRDVNRGFLCVAEAPIGRLAGAQAGRGHPRPGDPPGATRVVVAADDGELELPALPVSASGSTWGVLAFEPAALSAADLRLLRSAASQLSVGLSRLSLVAEKEQLAAQEERARIAREIHDGIAQSLYMLTLQLEKIAATADAEPSVMARLQRLVSLAKESLIEVRHYIFDLKPMLDGRSSIVTTIRGQAAEFSAVAELPVEVVVEGEQRDLPLPVCTELYRVVQEALANTYRHASATAATVHMHFTADRLRLEVQDNGVGFDGDEEGGAGRGLRHMRERVEALGGGFEIRSAPGAGTAIFIDVALPASSGLVIR